MVSGWRGAVFQIIQIAASTVIYYPFFKLVDNKAYKIETEGQDAVNNEMKEAISTTEAKTV